MLDAVETQLAETALDNVVQARNLPEGVWPTGTLEAAHAALAALLNQAPPEPEPEPEPVQYLDVRSYLHGHVGQCHWDNDCRAVDWYPAPKGTWFGWPVAGNVSGFSSPGPMGSPLWTARYQCTEAPLAGWTFYFTHVMPTVTYGQYAAHQPFAQVGDSGIESLPGNPSHIHLFVDAPGGATITPDGKGDVRAIDGILNLGFQVEVVAQIPGPNDYLMGRAYAGRFV